MSVKIGEKENSSLGFDSLLSLNPYLSIDGVKLTKKEIKEILELSDGLALIKGKWVEIDHEKLEFEYLDKEVLLSFVPKKIIEMYVVNKEYKEKALSLYSKHINPIKYKKDFSLKRNYLLYKKDKRYFEDYKDGYWENK
jgi:hypothetical protein